jgi:flagellar biosynthesis protein FlhG
VKPIDSQDHYEMLEVSPSATTEELDRAYRIALSAYHSGSLASYSIFDESDASVIRERIEHAYQILSNPDTRLAYDASIGVVGGDTGPEPVELAPVVEAGGARSAEIAQGDAFEDLEAEAEEEEEGFDGARLRRARLRRGIDLDEIATVTKVSPNYLQCLEADRFDHLPARVYVRGFVGAYARAIGLDEQRVTETYMAHFDEAGSAPPKGRLLGRG